MRTSRKWVYATALTLGGLLSATCSCFGLFGLLWGGFLNGDGSWKEFGFFLPFLVSLPLFILSLGITRLAVFALWIDVLYHWIALVLLSTHDAANGPSGLFAVIALCLFQGSIFMLLLLACLTLFGIQIFSDFSFDRYLSRKFGAKSATAN